MYSIHTGIHGLAIVLLLSPRPLMARQASAHVCTPSLPCSLASKSQKKVSHPPLSSYITPFDSCNVTQQYSTQQQERPKAFFLLLTNKYNLSTVPRYIDETITILTKSLLDFKISTKYEYIMFSTFSCNPPPPPLLPLIVLMEESTERKKSENGTS